MSTEAAQPRRRTTVPSRWKFLQSIYGSDRQKLRRQKFCNLKLATTVDYGLGNPLAGSSGVGEEKRIVYLLKNDETPPRYYTGLTSNLRARLLFHNKGLCQHTSTGAPWQIDVVVEFADERRALAFEKYLKSGSGVAFSKRHLRTST